MHKRLYHDFGGRGMVGWCDGWLVGWLDGEMEGNGAEYGKNKRRWKNENLAMANQVTNTLNT